jgi:hypothetical protein
LTIERKARYRRWKAGVLYVPDSDTSAVREAAAQEPEDTASAVSLDLSQHKAGSGGLVPAFIDRNSKLYVDHVFITMDHVAPQHSRDVVAKLAMTAFLASGAEDRDVFRGVVVQETHADGSLHLHGCFWSCFYMSQRTVFTRAREADKRYRGWREQPELVTSNVRFGGKGRGRVRERLAPKPGTGVPWHLNVAFWHTHDPNSKAVLSGKKEAGTFKAQWKFNDMVRYVLEPAKDKKVDETPLFVNCDEVSEGKLLRCAGLVLRVQACASLALVL